MYQNVLFWGRCKRDMPVSLCKSILVWNIAENFKKPGRFYFFICDRESTLEDAIQGERKSSFLHRKWDENLARCYPKMPQTEGRWQRWGIFPFLCRDILKQWNSLFFFFTLIDPAKYLKEEMENGIRQQGFLLGSSFPKPKCGKLLCSQEVRTDFSRREPRLPARNKLLCACSPFH